MRLAGLPCDDGPPRADEILIPLAMWSAIFELYLPHVRYFEHLATADHVDVLYDAIGAFAASVLWQVMYRGQPQASVAPRVRRPACPSPRVSVAPR
jgi:hypothetical protein